MGVEQVAGTNGNTLKPAEICPTTSRQQYWKQRPEQDRQQSPAVLLLVKKTLVLLNTCWLYRQAVSRITVYLLGLG